MRPREPDPRLGSKNLGRIIGKAGGTAFTRRVEELLGRQGLLWEAVRPLLEVREKVRREIAGLTRKLLGLARDNEDSRRSMTVPGIGPITALAFYAAVDDPTRFRRSRSVGAYFGLTPRRYASGEVDWSGRITESLTLNPRVREQPGSTTDSGGYPQFRPLSGAKQPK